MSEEKNKLDKKYPKVVVGAFIFNDQGELFLMKTIQWKNHYAVPGGKVELGETILEAVKREIKEETNIDIKNIKFISISEGLGLDNNIYSSPDNHLIFLNFKASVEDASDIKLNEEGTKYKWLKPEKWLKKKHVVKFTREIIEKYLIEAVDYKNKYLRTLADYQNLLKQTAKEKQEFAKFANEQLFLEILPVYDNLKMSLKHAGEGADKNGWLKGVKYIIKQFKDVLNNLGVEEIDVVNKKFDHNTMDAVKGKGDKVVQEISAGYKLNGKVIAPAKVILE